MPPNPSLPGSPGASRSEAHSWRSDLMGSRRRAMTNDAKSGETGQPWLMPYFMRCVRHDPLSHLW
jgi:hypothetical protein